MRRSLVRTLLIFIISALSNEKTVNASDKNVRDLLEIVQGLLNFNNFQGCQFNEVLIHEDIFPNFACWKCYESFKTSRRLVKVNCRILRDDVYYSVPGFVVEDGCVPFDHRTKSISKLVQSSLTNSTFERWNRCCSDAVDCCETMISSYQVENFLSTCDNHWDGSSCYHDTLPFETVRKVCPYQKIKNEHSKCNRKFLRSFKN